MKIKVGIFFGGSSREREISFAGGRTVYDNLNKTLFEPVPFFVDSFGNFVLIKWEYIYKGSIRDFYPPVDHLPHSPNEFQIYAESLGNLSLKEQEELTKTLGRRVETSELSSLIDFAFLCLHGTSGEDGRIQGLLEYHNIPYSGSGILSSSIGMNKAVQKQLMINSGFISPAYLTITRYEWKREDREELFRGVKERIGFPFVVKAANQGSSIGLSIVNEDKSEDFERAVNKSFFIREITSDEWLSLDEKNKVELLKTLTDIREGIGLPLQIFSDKGQAEVIYHPEELLKRLESHFATTNVKLILEAFDAESEIIIEDFIEGKEFSCIVVEDDNGKVIALPPTEIRKGKELFDYRSKYLPGLSRKITPINLPSEQIQHIRQQCEKLFKALFFNVYARIDGFINTKGEVFLNDPNTTSGMMPSSFFFHQAAEIGLNPSQFLTYIIRNSLAARVDSQKSYFSFNNLLIRLDEAIRQNQLNKSEKLKIAVILGGYSSERHISVESGRNVYEKLASSEKYEPIPVFLTGNEEEHTLYRIPVNILLKDNADDIKEKIEHFHVHEVIRMITEEAAGITSTYSSAGNIAAPQRLSYEDLAGLVDGAFIALHGRPGEDGVVQSNLERVGLPYNGSGQESSSITINKYETNEILKNNGFSVAKHMVFNKSEWVNDKENFMDNILAHFSFPFIAKPVDDGCSSAVKKIKNRQELGAFCELIFRNVDELNPVYAEILNLKLKEEFSRKNAFLVEDLVTKGTAKHFLEVTGGLLTHLNNRGEVEYEMFEASEALSEGDVLSLEEKFLAGQGQNITPARYAKEKVLRDQISEKVKDELKRACRVLKVEGYARIDAFVRVYENNEVEVIFIEVNSLPGMTPATCIFHQCAINGYKPYEFINSILEFGFKRRNQRALIN